MHLFYVQGGGLGHLTRTDKFIKTQGIPEDKVLIITPSTFTDYFKTYQYIKIAWSDSPSQWSAQIIATLNEQPVYTCYIDAFPFGLKGELLPVYEKRPDINYVYVSRILKWETYLKSLNIKHLPIVFSKTLILEKLYATHSDWVSHYSKKVLNLSLKSENMPSVPFTNTPYVMVVHSGGQQDVLKIYQKAMADWADDPNINIIVFTQVALQIKNEKVKVICDVFPVVQHYKNAIKIYTAAGFNSVQELQQYRDKHILTPLEKLYDDQFFRTAALQDM